MALCCRLPFAVVAVAVLCVGCMPHNRTNTYKCTGRMCVAIFFSIFVVLFVPQIIATSCMRRLVNSCHTALRTSSTPSAYAAQRACAVGCSYVYTIYVCVCIGICCSTANDGIVAAQRQHATSAVRCSTKNVVFQLL